MVGTAAAAAVLALAACAPAPAPGSDPSASSADAARAELTGVVAVTAGPAGRDVVTLQPDGGRQVALSGAPAEELRNIDGARVRLVGRRTAGAAPGGGVEAESYELLSIDGERPTVGILRVTGQSAMLEIPGGSMVRLAGAPPALLSRAGAKVWVTGRAGSEGLAVTSYGVLRVP
jgi:hypothetical protein